MAHGFLVGKDFRSGSKLGPSLRALVVREHRQFFFVEVELPV